jgi:rsbT antagonist protein RsbS
VKFPVIQVGNCLIATLTEDIGDAEALDLQETLNDRIEKTAATGVLLDISVLETIDSFLGRLLNEITLGARLLGAETVVAGMQPAVAMTLVELGVTLKGVRSALDAERGLALLGQHLNGKRR